jgi:hypothetical protein
LAGHAIARGIVLIPGAALDAIGLTTQVADVALDENVVVAKETEPIKDPGFVRPPETVEPPAV